MLIDCQKHITKLIILDQQYYVHNGKDVIEGPLPISYLGISSYVAKIDYAVYCPENRMYN